jgi:hypothetical protein
MATLYDGMSRAPLRVGVALVGCVDAIGLAVQIHRTAKSELSHPAAPRFLLALHEEPITLAAIVAVAISCFVAFARRRCSVTTGLLALLALAVLSESHAALVGGPARSFYVIGAVTLGWVFGLAYARGVSSGGLRRAAANEERLAEIGAVGMFAATYVGAAASKLILGGTDWANSNHLRAIVASQHPVGDSSLLGIYANAVVNHGGLSEAFGLATLVVQFGAFMLLISPTTRKVWTLAILGFHLNVLLLVHILYAESVVIAVLFGFPWPMLVARLRRRALLPSVEAPFAPASPRAARLTFALAVCGFGALAAIGSFPLVRGYTAEHHRPQPGPRGPEQAAEGAASGIFEVDPVATPDARALLGGLNVGDTVATLHVAALHGPSKGAIDIALRDQTAGLLITVTTRGVSPRPAPRSSEHYDLFYRDRDLGLAPATARAREEALDDVLARIISSETRVSKPEGM